MGLRFARSATASPWAGPPNSAMHASAGSCVSRSASAPTASGRARGSRRSRSESRPARRTPGSGSRTRSRSGSPAAFRPSVPAADAAARRTPGSRSASSSRTALARVGDAEGRGDLDGGRGARPDRASPARGGAAAWPRAGTACRGGGSPRRAPGRRRARRPARAASPAAPLVAAGPERQGREAIGGRVRAVGDDRRPAGRAARRRHGRAATRGSRPLRPARAGRPGGAAGSRAASGPSPGSSAGARPAGRRRRGRPAPDRAPRRSPRSAPRRRCSPGAGPGDNPSRPTAPASCRRGRADRRTVADEPGPVRGPGGRSGRRRPRARPGRRAPAAPGYASARCRPVDERQHGGPVRRSAHRLHGRVRQGGVGMAERPVQPGRRSRPAQPADRDRDFQDDARVAPVGEGGQSRGQIGVARIARQAMLGEDRVGQVGHGADGLGLDARIGIGPGRAPSSSSIAAGPPGRARTQTACSRPRTPRRPALDRVAHGVERLASAAFEAHLGVEPLGVARRVEQGDVLLDLAVRRVAARAALGRSGGRDRGRCGRGRAWAAGRRPSRRRSASRRAGRRGRSA